MKDTGKAIETIDIGVAFILLKNTHAGHCPSESDSVSTMKALIEERKQEAGELECNESCRWHPGQKGTIQVRAKTKADRKRLKSC